MRIYYDTEFVEDGRTVDLISIGMVREDGAELYLVNEEIDSWIVSDSNGDNALYDKITKGSNAEFLMTNVIPHLPIKKRYDGKPIFEYRRSDRGSFRLDEADNRVVSRRYIRNAVRAFVLDVQPGERVRMETGLGLSGEPEITEMVRVDPVELWAWYGAYDHLVLAQLFGRMVDLPAGFPMYTCDIQQYADHLGVGEDRLPPQPKDAHNALADARWVRDAWRALHDIELEMIE